MKHKSVFVGKYTLVYIITSRHLLRIYICYSKCANSVDVCTY